MSDSDEDFMPNSAFKYRHERTGMHTHGLTRNNNTHVSSFSTKNNNKLTLTFDMQNYERQRSPMSLRSFPDQGIQNLHNSYYPRGMTSQRSVFNGRSGSPMSVRSIDSNASVISAADIASAFKNNKFNKYDLRVIKEAYCRLMKHKVRKRIEKRRNLKLFLKRTRMDTGYDSGEQGSNSSISSDDCRSTKTAIYKENLPLPRARSRIGSLKTNMTQLRNSIQESDMYQDCTENLKHNHLRNMLAVKNTQVNVIAVNNTTIDKPENGSLLSLKDRFANSNSILLPSERFASLRNKTNVDITKSQPNAMQTRQPMFNVKEMATNKIFDGNSENEEIFPEVTMRESVQELTLPQRKRNLNVEETNYSDKKRKKLTSPIKHNNESLVSSTLATTQNNDFIFKQPQMPLRKSTKGKVTMFNDKLIAKSAPPLVDNLEPDFSLLSNKHRNRDTVIQNNSTLQVPQSKETEEINNETEISQNTTDVSLRPSFIKRKLFSQNLDVLDKKNQSSDNLALNSPQTKLYAGKKNKVRKLASSQSCLNLDGLGDDNVLDLIHKIVPRDKMNITNAQNKKRTRKSQDDDKWDVTSVISMCNNDDGSDTYTDEEIFKIPQSTTNNKVINNTNKAVNSNSDKSQSIQSKKVAKQKSNEMPKNKNITKKAELVLKKLSPKIVNQYVQDKPIQNQNKRTVSSCVKSFWDTDFESDMEDCPPLNWNSKFAAGKDHGPNSIVNNTINLPKRNGLKGTILTVRSTQNKGVNGSSRSDRSRVSQRKNQNDNLANIEQVKNEIINKKANCKVNLNISAPEVKKKRGRKKSKDLNISNSAPLINKTKEPCNKQKKCDSAKKNDSHKIRLLPPRKVNESKRLSSPKSNESSFNCSNISSRSLRMRKISINYRC